LLGNKAIIGYSTHNVAQAEHARSLPIDYLAIGPIYPTFAKAKADPEVGPDGLRRVRAVIGEFPLVAIGGITRARAREVFAAGADSVACISALLNSGDDIEKRVREFLE
jgi:thiamine-phosphate pyrophosphorylase